MSVVGRAQPAADVETIHFRLRAWQADDVASLAIGCAEPDVMRYFLDGRCLRYPEVERLVESFGKHWRSHGFGLWAVHSKAIGRCVGYAGLADAGFVPGYEHEVEVGWRLELAFASFGNELEIARACVAWGFGNLGPARLISVFQAANSRWRAVTEALDMTTIATVRQNVGGRPDPTSATRARTSRSPDRFVELEIVGMSRSGWERGRASQPRAR